MIIRKAPRLRCFSFAKTQNRISFLAVEAIILPFCRVFAYVIYMFFIILLVADDVVVKIPLPYIMSVFLIAKTLKG